ncbi:hypothetical protein MHU86_23938 [Fragilaria crotonensis]|nr:hypothetical protein MHU86_23938 [Fragilaria crotonensis]
MKIERGRPVFFEDIKHDASLWVYRHGLRNIVLAELLKQTHAFPRPSMRRQLMREIRIVARDRMKARRLDFMMLVSANQPLMEEIRARRRRRLAVKAKYLHFKQQVHVHVERRRIIHMFQNVVLPELLKQTHAFPRPSMRRQLMKEIRIAARDRKKTRPRYHMMVVSANYPLMEQIRTRRLRRSGVKAKYLHFKQQVQQHLERRRNIYMFQSIVLPELLKQTRAFPKPSMRRQLMREIRTVTHRKQVMRNIVLAELLKQTHAFPKPSMRRQLMTEIRTFKHRKQVMRNIVLAELVKQTHAFPKPSMRHQLMKEIRIAARSRMECKPVGIAGLPTSNQALMKEIRGRGLERASAKANHSLAMHELLDYFHAKKSMEVLHQYVSSRKLDEEMKRMLLVDLDEQRENIMFEQHQHKVQLHQTKEDPNHGMLSPRCIREVMLSDQRFGDFNTAA